MSAALQQALGRLGSASMVDDAEKIAAPILVYRLVALDPTGPWKGGLLLELAKQFPDDDDALELA
eukprot:5152729-Prymnesium_polylepis.1